MKKSPSKVSHNLLKLFFQYLSLKNLSNLRYFRIFYIQNHIICGTLAVTIFSLSLASLHIIAIRHDVMRLVTRIVQLNSFLIHQPWQSRLQHQITRTWKRYPHFHSTFIPLVSILDQAVTPSCSRKRFHFLFLYYLCYFQEFAVFNINLKKNQVCRTSRVWSLFFFFYFLKRSYILTH